GGDGNGSGGAMDLPACGPEAAENAQGVLTSHPGLTFDAGHPDFRVDTVNIIPYVAPSGIDTLDMYVELTNVGVEDHCSFLFDARLDGFEIFIQTHTLPVTREGFTVTSGCTRPGDTAILVGLQNDLSPEMIDAATSLELNMTTLVPLDPLSLPTDAPIVDATLEEGPTGGLL